MTLSTTTSRITYAGDGSTVAFAVPFSFFGADEIDVIERDAQTGTETLRVLATDYTVSGGGGAMGTVTAMTPPDGTKSWTIARRTKRTQMVDYTPNDAFPAETHERALDRLTALVQELDEKLGRAAALSPTSPLINVTLPAPESGKLLGWRSDADGLENKSFPSATTIYSTIAATRSGALASEAVTPRSLASLWRKGSDIASEATLARPIENNLGGYHVVTGTTTIAGLWSGEAPGTEIELRFSAALTLIHNAASFVLPGGASIVASAGDVARFRAEGGANWRCVSAPPAWFGQTSAISLPVSSKSTTYTMLATDRGSEISFTTSGATLNLLPAAVAGNGALIAVRNSAVSGDVIIDPSGAETLDGLATRLLRPGDCVLLRCDGSAWRTTSGAYSFESAEQSLAIGIAVSVAHGLGVRPNHLRAVFRCKTGEGNWVPGDEIEYSAVQWTYSGALAADSANAVATFNQIYAPAIGNKSSGVSLNLGLANWKLVFFCKDMRG